MIDAVEGNNALVLDTQEKELGKEVSLIETKAESIVIKNDEDFAEAAEFAKMIKQRQKYVKDFFEPMRISTKSAYDAVLARKKETLDPLDRAEKIIKNTMNVYTDEQERKRRELEEKMRMQAKLEMEKKLKEAAALEAEGDYISAEMAMVEAEVMENASENSGLYVQKPQAKGVSQTKDWVIESIDRTAVPIDFCGMELRPVDESAIIRLIKASKGSIKIPGVVYKETVRTSIRS